MQYKQRTINRKHRITLKKAKAKESAAKAAVKNK
jgi:hypothetical protein